jgi:hypothetical protein
MHWPLTIASASQAGSPSVQRIRFGFEGGSFTGASNTSRQSLRAPPPPPKIAAFPTVAADNHVARAAANQPGVLRRMGGWFSMDARVQVNAIDRKVMSRRSPAVNHPAPGALRRRWMPQPAS